MTQPGDPSERPQPEQEPPRGTQPPPAYGQPSYPPPQYQQPPGSYPPPRYQPGYSPAPYPGGYGAQQAKTNGLAIGSLVASIVSIPFAFFCFIGALGSIAGIVLGIVALNQIKQSGEQGRGLAIGGIAVGAVALVLFLVLIIIGVGLRVFGY